MPFPVSRSAQKKLLPKEFHFLAGALKSSHIDSLNVWRPQDNDLDNWEMSFDFGRLDTKLNQL